MDGLLAPAPAPALRCPDSALRRESWHRWIGSELRSPVGPRWPQRLWTALFCAALAVVFTLVGLLALARGQGARRNLDDSLLWYCRNLVVCGCIGALVS